tara:strand:+ start:799 stop:969 length:171 start_codon:yes stop_codon:yes gene_type:complete
MALVFLYEPWELGPQRELGRNGSPAGELRLLEDRMQDFFMSDGKWEMANGRWHIDQ